ncbi:MAG: phage tail protein [Arsenophonus sp. NEOnobi-MAG3]
MLFEALLYSLFSILVALLTQQALTQLSSSTNNDNETLSATQKAVKVGYNFAKEVKIQ